MQPFHKEPRRQLSPNLLARHCKSRRPGEPFVLQAHAEGCVEVQVAQSVGAKKQVPGDFARPGLCVDQVAASASGQGSQLREDCIYCALQTGFSSSQV